MMKIIVFSATFPKISVILWDMHFLVWHIFLSGTHTHFCPRPLNPPPFFQVWLSISTLQHLTSSYLQAQKANSRGKVIPLACYFFIFMFSFPFLLAPFKLSVLDMFPPGHLGDVQFWNNTVSSGVFMIKLFLAFERKKMFSISQLIASISGPAHLITAV